AEDGIRYFHVTGVQTCALPIWRHDAPDEFKGAAGCDGCGRRGAEGRTAPKGRKGQVFPPGRSKLPLRQHALRAPGRRQRFLREAKPCPAPGKPRPHAGRTCCFWPSREQGWLSTGRKKDGRAADQSALL